MPRYELLNGARPLASFRLEQNETAAVQDAKTEYRVTDVAVLNGNAALPCGVTHEPYTILSWLVRRRAPTERYHIERVLEACGALSLIGFLNVSLALSLKDAYWIRPVGSRQRWEDVSLYRRRRFRDDIAAAALTGWKLPLANVRPPVLSPEFTTDGYLPKCWVKEHGRIVLLKGGREPMSNAGREPYSEYYAALAAEAVGIPCVHYGLTEYRGCLASACEAFSTERHGFVSAWELLTAEERRTTRGAETLEIVAQRLGDGGADFIEDMMVFDAITGNTDRHLGNFGALVDNETGAVRESGIQVPLWRLERCYFDL